MLPELLLRVEAGALKKLLFSPQQVALRVSQLIQLHDEFPKPHNDTLRLVLLHVC